MPLATHQKSMKKNIVTKKKEYENRVDRMCTIANLSMGTLAPNYSEQVPLVLITFPFSFPGQLCSTNHLAHYSIRHHQPFRERSVCDFA